LSARKRLDGQPDRRCKPGGGLRGDTRNRSVLFVDISADLRLRVDRAAEAAGMNRSAFVRYALEWATTEGVRS
jgi:hypothetical protein